MDALDEIKSRCFGVQAAIRGVEDNCDEREGVEWLMGDLGNSIQRLKDAFEAEMELRSAEERQPS